MGNQGRQGQTYQLVLRGELGDHFATFFDGMRLERVAGTTVLTGTVDQAQLHGLIEQAQELGLELLSVTQPNDSGPAER
jgi:hypothetical protein